MPEGAGSAGAGAMLLAGVQNSSGDRLQFQRPPCGSGGLARDAASRSMLELEEDKK